MKKFTLILSMLVLFVFSGLPVFASAAADWTVDGQGKTGELVLLHTNDHHGAVLPNGGRGGLAEVAAYIKAVRVANKNVLLLDAGDINTGSALSNMFNAEPDIRSYNLMSYDAAAFGNHEFDGNYDKLKAQIALAEFPFVSSNIKTAEGEFLGGHQYIIKKYDGFTVGIFGITTLRTLTIASPDKSLVFINEIEAAREAVNLLRNVEKVDIVIGLTHIGDIGESPDHITSLKLAEEVSGIDIIVDGHSHSFFAEAKRAGDTWIVTANEWGKYVGYGKLSIQNGQLVNFEWAPIEIAPDTDVAALLDPYIKKANESLKEVVGEAAETFVFGNRLTRYGETAIGNMITDANVWYFKTLYNQNIDFAFHNGGNIRAELPKGKLTREQILTVLPFENYLYIVSLKGSDIIELFNFIASIPQGAGGFAQVSKEVRYIIDYSDGDGVLKNLTIGGAPVDPGKIYRFCTNDYILGGGDGYEVMKKAAEPFNTSLLLSYVVIEYIYAQNGLITPKTDGRLTIIGGKTP
ncbi:MAG: 5'-nucleotidase C-terminal domain-containing protein [Treponema sp.]|jgi:5'-nucleotidase/UDP-sugar diphosphatase|nr:5'-nucleotidase C-terminal domain-containing protein [Treponema sp.]